MVLCTITCSMKNIGGSAVSLYWEVIRELYPLKNDEDKQVILLTATAEVISA